MTERSGADQVGHGEASLGDAQSHNPPDDPEYVSDVDRRSELASTGGRNPDTDLDTDVEWQGEGHPPEEERGNEDPAPNAP